jgi:hypothetical protein
MKFLLSFSVLLGAYALIASAFLYLFAPQITRRVLKSAATTLGFMLLVRSVSSTMLVVSATITSTIAYFIREQRRNRRVHREPPRYSERLPVMPQHITPDGEE